MIFVLPVNPLRLFTFDNSLVMPFAQLVIGPPGSGKSTYCDGMHQFLSAIGRKCSVVNLDPANDRTSYPCALDIRELVTLEEIMQNDELGPNGAVLYALEELEHNWEWTEGKLKELGGWLDSTFKTAGRDANASLTQTTTCSSTVQAKSSYSRTTARCATSFSGSRSSGTESAPTPSPAPPPPRRR